MSITLARITPVQHASAVEWITCAFDLEDGDLGRLSPNQVHRTMQQRYSGGWEGFVADLGDDNWA